MNNPEKQYHEIAMELAKQANPNRLLNIPEGFVQVVLKERTYYFLKYTNRFWKAYFPDEAEMANLIRQSNSQDS